ncbi:MAG: hypothetical protein JXQ97_04030 [Natronospirillum sp.]
MIIQSHNIVMGASHHHELTHQVRESRRIERLDDTAIAESPPQRTPPTPQQQEPIPLTSSAADPNMTPQTALRAKVLQSMFKATFRNAVPVEFSPMQRNTLPIALVASGPINITPTGATGRLIYERHEMLRDAERSHFHAHGEVITQDGQHINIGVQLSMSREFVERTSLRTAHWINENNELIDPLVINFDGRGVQLADQRFRFDLTVDGEDNNMAALQSGSGYLALDRNGDGLINDGSELFGPISGKGFDELAQYDEDGNGFIDAGDSIYEQLRIWEFLPDGSSQLVGLADRNVGAIYLGHVSSPFQIRDRNNELQGEIANSSIWLNDEGRVGVVQELHLVV